MPKITKIWLDMDGVIADFDPAFSDYFSGKPNDHTFHDAFENFIADNRFEDLPMMKDAHKLINFLYEIEFKKGIQTEILSSTGASIYHDRVKQQKGRWLYNKEIIFPFTLVPGSNVKKYYATKNSVIIDDSENVIEDWKNAGGIAIWHNDVNATIQTLMDLIWS